MEDVERQVVAEALRRLDREQEPDPAAPVVADQLHPLDPELVEDREDVVGEALLHVAVAFARGVAPAEPAQVHREHPVTVGEGRHQVPPLVPVLRPAVEAEDGVVPRPGLGDVEVDDAARAAACRKSATTSSMLPTLQATFSGQGRTGCSPRVFSPFPLITTTTVS